MRQIISHSTQIAYCISLLVLVPSLAIGLPKGKPFQELKGMINSNSAEISTVREDLNHLTFELEALAQSVANTNLSLDALQTQVNANTNDLAYAFSLLTQARNDIDELSLLTLANQQKIDGFLTSINELEGAIDAQRYELLSLVDSLNAHLDTQAEQLSKVRTEIDAIAANNIGLAQQLASQALTITQFADTQNTAVLSIQAEVDLLNTNLTLSNANYIYLTSAYEALDDNITTLTTQLAQLEQAVAELDAQAGAASGDNGGTSGPVLFSFVDEFSVNDTQHVTQLRQFLASNDSLNQWVHVIFTTPAVGRTTELCFFDQSDVFNQARRFEPHPFTVSENNQGSARLNGGDWQQVPEIVVQSRNDDNFDYIFVRAPEITNAVTSLTTLKNGSPEYDSYHQRRYFTVVSQSATTATYTIGADRLSACGY